VEDVEFTVLFAGRNYDAGMTAQFYDDADEAVGEAVACTVVSKNAATVALTIADPVVGSIRLANGEVESDAYVFEITLTPT
jgi:hypothetical protein